MPDPSRSARKDLQEVDLSVRRKFTGESLPEGEDLATEIAQTIPVLEDA